MPQRSSSSVARQCLRLCHPQASSRTRLSSLKTLHQSPSASSSSTPYICLCSSHPLNFRASSFSRSSFAPRPARPRQSWSEFRLRAPYSTSPPISSPESLSAEQYHELADSYIDSLLVHLEQLQEERADVDCEYSVRFFPRLLTVPKSTTPPPQTAEAYFSRGNVTGRRFNPHLSATRHLCAE